MASNSHFPRIVRLLLQVSKRGTASIKPFPFTLYIPELALTARPQKVRLWPKTLRSGKDHGGWQCLIDRAVNAETARVITSEYRKPKEERNPIRLAGLKGALAG